MVAISRLAELIESQLCRDRMVKRTVRKDRENEQGDLTEEQKEHENGVSKQRTDRNLGGGDNEDRNGKQRTEKAGRMARAF
jgi:hypothetical protein